MDTSNATNPKNPYAFSLNMYIVEAALAYLISIITSGTYLAKLTTTLGISDSTTAILSAISSLAGVFQLIAIPIAYRSSSKRVVIPLLLINQLLYSLLYLIPFSGIESSVLSVIFFVCILLSVIFAQISSPLTYYWFMSLCEPIMHGSYTAKVQIFSHISGIIFSFIASLLLDHFEEANNLDGIFIIFAVMIFFLSILHLLTLLFSKEKPRETKNIPRIQDSIVALLKNKKYLHYLLVCSLYSMSLNISNPFFGTYQIKELGLSMLQVYALSVINSLSAIVFLPIFGNYARRNGLIKSMCIGFPLCAVSFLIISFTIPSNGFICFAIFYCIYTLGSAALTVGMEPTVLELVGENEKTAAIAFKAAVVGLLAFFTTVSITPLMNYIQDSGNKIFGIHIYAQQLFGAMSFFVMLLATVLFYGFSKNHHSDRVMLH